MGTFGAPGDVAEGEAHTQVATEVARGGPEATRLTQGLGEAIAMRKRPRAGALWGKLERLAREDVSRLISSR